MSEKIYKHARDFEGTYVDNDLKYHIYGIKDNFKKGDKLIIDLCIFRNRQTLINATVIKAYKHTIVVDFEYM